MKAVILQPSYIPWRGYFDQVHKADVFVFYDDVQYDTRGWRNRNRVKTPQGSRWLTVPVHSQQAQIQHTPIKEITIDWDTDWNRTHLSTLTHLYGKAPFFKRYRPLLDEFYGNKQREYLADLCIDLTVAIAGELGIAQTRFLRSSDLAVGGAKTERLIAVLQAIGATHYISGPSARDYIEPAKFAAAGISLEYMVYDYPEYRQLYPPFDPYVTILDLLFMAGPDAPAYIWGGAGAAGYDRAAVAAYQPAASAIDVP